MHCSIQFIHNYIVYKYGIAICTSLELFSEKPSSINASLGEVVMFTCATKLATVTPHLTVSRDFNETVENVPGGGIRKTLTIIAIEDTQLTCIAIGHINGSAVFNSSEAVLLVQGLTYY